MVMARGSFVPRENDSPKEEIEQAKKYAQQSGLSLDQMVNESQKKKERIAKLDNRIKAAKSRSLVDSFHNIQ